MSAADSVDAVVTRVLQSRRYGGLAPELVRRLAAEEMPKARTAGDAEKRVKRRLHQIFGAYATRPDFDRVLANLRAAVEADEPEGVRATCLAAMAVHASTRERLPIVESFYVDVFAVTGLPASVLDVGCGLNPLAIPWMGLPLGCPYAALDIDLELVAFLNDALPLLGVAGSGLVRDVVAEPPVDEYDVALMLKTVPCLEQQRPGIGLDLLWSIRARQIVVSYPTRSLGGHARGMARVYRAAFERMADTLERPFIALELPGELVFVLSGATPSGSDAGE